MERRLVVALSYPCEMYSDGILTRVQTIAVVREGYKLRIPPDWYGAFYTCPLPDLFRDGKTWGVDFRTISNVDRSFLTPANRVECLTEYAWAFLRQRLATYFTRVSCHLDDLRDAGNAAWDEVELWERWCALGRRAEDFQAWLDEMDVNIGSSRRQALQRGMTRLVISAM
ncbi:MAG: hypothetical protein Q7O66_14825 [Dehalococcoidia bacterium]|nr:hypothetical protein [Dehalococcoidia bacterium]